MLSLDWQVSVTVLAKSVRSKVSGRTAPSRATASLSTTSTIDLIGAERHSRAVEQLRASYLAIPSGSPVRLAKSTSNLFRTRAATKTPGLDVSDLTGVISLDVDTATADVQGVCTYEDLVNVTLARGFIPYVVPQLRTITLGGAVAGLGIESTSFRNGLPHESVTEMDIFCGDGRVRTVQPGDDLFDAFPNSYGSLGYATRLRIKLEAVPQFVKLTHVRFDDLDKLASATAEIVATGTYGSEPVDALDGVVFEPTEGYLTIARFTDEPGPTSDYTGMQIFYRSLQVREQDRLTMLDYLWRWDTDWFWCSGAFGLHNPRIRRWWPKRWRRSNSYHKLVGLERRYRFRGRIDQRRGLPDREYVIQDVEVPVERVAEFLRWFDDELGMRPVWLCPLRCNRAWPAYPLEPETTYINVGFWGTVPIAVGASDGDLNRAIEAKVPELDGHKSLYSDSYFDQETFAQLYDQTLASKVRLETDPDDRLAVLYEKAVARR